jgi:hypothetical protein
LPRAGVTIDEFWIGRLGLLTPYTFNSGLQVIQRYRLSTSQITDAHAPGCSVFTSRILATELHQSHCHFKSHMKFSFHSLIPFLTLFCNCQLNSIPLLPSSYPGRLASRNSSLFYSAKNFFMPTLQGPRRKHSLYC